MASIAVIEVGWTKPWMAGPASPADSKLRALDDAWLLMSINDY